MTRGWCLAVMLTITQDPKPPEPYPEELVERFEDAARERSGEATLLLKQLDARYEALAEEDRKKLLRVLETRLIRTREKDTLDLPLAILKVFERVGPLGAEETIRALRHQSVAERPDLLAETILSLARHHDPKHPRLLFEYLVHQEKSVFFAAIDALGEYDKVEEKHRKVIVEQLLRSYSSTISSSLPPPPGSRRTPGKPDPFKTGDKDRAREAEAHFDSALARLTGETNIHGVTNWEKWYREARRKRWDQ